MGVRGVWLQGILYQLTPFPFDPALSTGWEARIAALNRLIARAKRHGIGVYLYLNEPRSMPDAFFARYPHLRGAREGDFCAMCTSTDEVRAYLEDAAYRLFCAAPDLAGFFTISIKSHKLLFSRAGCGRLPALCGAPALGRGGRGEQPAGARRAPRQPRRPRHCLELGMG